VSAPFQFHGIEALILDIDGTLLRGETPLPGLYTLFAFLQARRIPFVVASNNATKSPQDYQDKLAALGVEVDLPSILTAAVATVDYLRHTLRDNASLYVIGEAALREALQAAGFRLRPDAGRPVAAVVVGGDSTLTYDKLKDAALLLQQGAPLVGTNPDLLCPAEEGLVPEAGTTLAALQAATGATPVIIGKPQRYLFDLAVERLDRPPERTAVVGDRLETDIVGGQRAGLRTILTTSGVDNEATVREKGIYPDRVVGGLEALVEIWQRETKEDTDEYA
jgi:4-nitrophenyl phosphatase